MDPPPHRFTFLPSLCRVFGRCISSQVSKNSYLPCDCTLPAHGTSVPVCWDKGPCPCSWCVNWVLDTDERNMTYQKSRRYQLKGNFLKGDVSLTIEKVTLADHGIYCCRVQFPGLGNDKKKKLDLELLIRPGE
ncbi:Hepatitis A virus cellular receptor 2 homolog [Lemmus lemmus]